MVGQPAAAPPKIEGEYMSPQRIHNRKSLKEVRRQLRRSLTPAEATLWKALQGSKLGGKKFRRQHSIGNYVVDFYCPECGLAVELDGDAHFTESGAEADAKRSAYLNQQKIRVLRFENREIFDNLEFVLAEIEKNLIS